MLAPLVLLSCGGSDEAPPYIEVVRAQIEGVAYLEEHRLDEAEATFRRVVEMAPRTPSAHADLGVVLLRTGRLEEAREAFERAVSLAPDDPWMRVSLARVLELEGREAEARDHLGTALEHEPAHPPALYALARLERSRGEPGASPAAELLERLLDPMEANVVVRLMLVDALLRVGEPDQAAAHLEELRRQVPALPPAGTEAFEEALDLALEGAAVEALDPLQRFHQALEATGRYQRDLRALDGPGGILEGIPTTTVRGRGAGALGPEEIAAGIRFVDITEPAGVAATAPRAASSDETRVGLAIGDLVGNGLPDIYVGSGLLFRNDGGSFVEVAHEAGIASDEPVLDARAADLSDSGRLDLYLVHAEGATLLRNEGGGTFGDVTVEAGFGSARGGAAALAVDADHDGDLDLVTVGGPGPARLFRNNLDGTFLERGAAAGLADAAGGTQVAFADFDDDDLVDLVVARAGDAPALFLNRGEGTFEEVSAGAGLAAAGPAAAVAAGDYDNDGRIDLFVGGTDPGDRRLHRNVGEARFEVDERPRDLYEGLADLDVHDALFVDYDNDGWLDLLVAGEPLTEGARGLRLFRNAGPGEWVDASASLPPVGAVSRVRVADLVGDGDLDIVAALPDGSVRVLRNDGGNLNHSLTLRLVALGVGGGKNNHFGIGATVEVRAGALHQVRSVTSPTTVVGLGDASRAEVVRVRWPNGARQVVDLPGGAPDVVEEQLLLGSCPFIYAWDGEEYRFVTDVLWQSALGMPVGIGGASGESVYAPPWPSRQHVRVPGDLLRRQDGEYRFQLTAELWETIYLDEARLVVVDHPGSVEVFVDERFPALDAGDEPRIHTVGARRPPASATDERGRDLLPDLLAPDFRYVANLRPGPFQGVTELHDLIMDLGEIPDGKESRLFLRGWIFPTDASINVAVAQSAAVEVIAPHLQVRDEYGRWVTVVEDLGFPAGKDKTLVVELTDLFRSADRTVRIRTNMEIYWDHAFVEVGRTDVALRSTTLSPSRADLRERGFSRMYRKGGRYGPHWFDYADVTSESPWGPIRGPFTRLGDVLPLVTEANDLSVVMAPGDAIDLRFDAEAVPPLPEGWARTFLFYSEGWVKDANLNTATGERTTPLPFHGMSEYPYAGEEGFPDTPAHRRYVEEILTRVPTSR